MGIFDTAFGATRESAREGLLLSAGAGAQTAHLVPPGWRRLTADEIGFDGGFLDGRMDAAGYFHGGAPWFGDPEAAVWRNGDRLAVAFRGADDLPGDFADLVFLAGDTYLGAFDSFLEAVARHAAAERIAEIVVTGASLGGAVANMLRDASTDRYGGAFETADYYALASPVIADRPAILNVGYENDWVYYAYERNLGAGDGPFPSATDNVFYFDAEFARTDWSPYSVSAHSSEAFADGLERIAASAFHDAMDEDSLVLLAAHRHVDTARLEGRTEAFGEGAFLIGREVCDRLVGGAGDDAVEALGRRDIVSGRGGDDTILAGAGSDKVAGGGGSDTIEGGDGHDDLYGGGGRDLIFGGRGRDLLHGGRGDDTLSGGGGRDEFVVSPSDGSDLITDFGGGDVLTVTGLTAAALAAAVAGATATATGTVLALGDAVLTLEGVAPVALAVDGDGLALL